MRSKPVILVALLLATFLVNLDTTLVNVALPAMVRQLHATTTQLQWVVDAYNLVFAALLLTFGSLSDRFGRKGMLLAGLAVVGGASLAGGFTTTPDQLIAARAVMGLGAAMTLPATLSLISNVFTERRERARAIGLWGAVAGVAIATGPIVGGTPITAGLGDQAATSRIIDRRTASPCRRRAGLVARLRSRRDDRFSGPAYPLPRPRSPVLSPHGHGPHDEQDARTQPSSTPPPATSSQPHHPPLTPGCDRPLASFSRVGGPADQDQAVPALKQGSGHIAGGRPHLTE